MTRSEKKNIIHFLLCHPYSKYGPYDYSYSGRLGESVRHPVAQKKHQMFGKRFLQDQSSVPNSPQLPSSGVSNGPPQSELPIKFECEPYGMYHPGMGHNLDIGQINKHQTQPHPLSQPGDVKYSCSLDFARQNRVVHDIVGHNHTYTLPQGTGATPRPQARDKKLQKKIDDEHLTRDEKRARSLNVCTVNNRMLLINQNYVEYYVLIIMVIFIYKSDSNASAGNHQFANGRI